MYVCLFKSYLIRVLISSFLQNAMVPNAVLVDSDDIQARTLHFLNFVIEDQDESGWLGPEVFDSNKPRYLWGRLVLTFSKRIIY